MKRIWKDTIISIKKAYSEASHLLYANERMLYI